MKNLIKILLVGYLIFPWSVSGQQSQSRTIHAVHVEEGIQVDGVLNEEVWRRSDLITGLEQQEPIEGADPSQTTHIRILYNERALMIGVRLFDNAPDSIVQRLGRRDADLNADRFTVYLDPYNDNQSGFYFGLNAAGTIFDGFLYNDYNRDDDWDGVWQHAVAVDSAGWVVEMRIPFSQIRYDKSNASVWGINFERIIARYNEEDYLVAPPRDASGFVSFFPEMSGIDSVDPPSYFEVEPYFTTKASYLDYQSGSPFYDGSEYQLNAGADFQTVVFDDLTLNGTVNPDFGQVEVDPAVVNLSDVETFYPEKRPFFINGSNYFRFGDGGRAINLNLNWPSPHFFYSRRIGRSPRGEVPSADYVDYPEATNIIGAAKVTGLLEGGWNVGALQAVTAREKARLSKNGHISELSVHPPTYYGITRLEQKADDGSRSVGMMATYTHRSFQRQALRNEINKSALFVGVDGYSFLDSNRAWVVSGWSGVSHVTGTAERMTHLQRNPVHYLQRPHSDGMQVDTSADSMTGYGGHLSITRQRGNILGLVSVGMLSPRFELNDAGFLSYTNVINMVGTVGYQWTEPTFWYRRVLVAGAYFQNLDYAGNNTGRGFWSIYQTTFSNYYSMKINGFVTLPSYDNRLTRGGPLARDLGNTSIQLNISTDDRRDYVLEVGGGIEESRDGSYSRSVEAEVTWKPAAYVSVSLNPKYAFQFKKAHYLNSYRDPTAEHTSGKRYVFAELRQQTLSSSLRLNWTFNPSLSLQVYAQPLISTGSYKQFKELSRPRSFDFKVYGQQGSTYHPGTGMADPDGRGPAPPIQLRDPDFNYKSLRGNAILRWQFRPGSTMYLVWTQRRSSHLATDRFDVGGSLSELARSQPDNIFLLKFSYWLNAGG